jgi:FkbM family methyltransferase
MRTLCFFLPLLQRINWFDLFIFYNTKDDKNNDAKTLVPVRLRKPTHRVVYIRKFNQTDKGVFRYTFFKGYHLPPLPLNKDCTILDLGANIGLTMVDFKQTYPHCKIWGFEMDKANYLLAQKNIDGLNDCWVENKAIWHEAGIVQYATNVEVDAYNISEQPKVNDATYQEVEAWSLEDVFEKYNLTKVDYIKMDIEGAEKSVLRTGKRNWLKKVNCLNIEIHDPTFLSEAMQILESFGFSCRKDDNHWSAVLAVRKSILL